MSEPMREVPTTTIDIDTSGTVADDDLLLSVENLTVTFGGEKGVHAVRGVSYEVRRHETLGTNYRSTRAMVEAVNHVFLQAERRPGAGAFLFRTEQEDPLPFVPVAAKGRKERWEVGGEAQHALTCWWLEAGSDPRKKPDYTRAMAQACAAEIVRLLTLAQQGEAGFRQEDGRLQALEPKDIAVLVNRPKVYDAAASGNNVVGWSPYNGIELPWTIDATWLRGKLAFDGTRVLADPRTGRFVRPELSPSPLRAGVRGGGA